MDDPWGNAWSEPTKPALYEPPINTSHFSGHARSLSTVGQEADLGAPSWSTGDEIQWAEPSGTQHSLWSEPDNAMPWDSSSYESIPIGKGATSTLDSVPASLLTEVNESFPVSRPSSPSTAPETSPSPPPSPHNLETTVPESLSVPVRSPPSRSASPDGYGTFETGLTVEDVLEPGEVDPWSPSAATSQLSPPAHQWDSTWSNNQSEKTEPATKGVDEWEAAKREKEQRDRKIPPEAVTALLRECEEFVNEVWPDSEASVSAEAEEDWRKDWRGGLEGVEGLDAFMKYLLPDTIPPTVQFKKSASAKEMVNAIRMSRNFPVSQASPMGHFLAGKGSTDWEALVKLQSRVAQDEVPMGWKVVEKQTSGPTPAPLDTEKTKKAGGGLLSFLSRRTSSQPQPVASTSRPTTPVLETRTSPLANGVRRSGEVVKVDIGTGRATPPVVSSSATSPSGTPSANFVETLTSVNSPTSLYDLPPQPDLPPVAHTPSPGPSAVSRFLNRFSRTGSSSSPRDSVALSSDDIDFLSDIVPSASEPDEEDDPQLRALSNMMLSKPVILPEKLPPPLAPPPKSSLPTSSRPSVIHSSELDNNSLVTSSTGSSSEFSARPSSTLPIQKENPTLSALTPAATATSPPSSSLSTDKHYALSAFPPLSSSRPSSRFQNAVTPPSQERSSPTLSTAVPILPPPPASRAHTPIFTSAIPVQPPLTLIPAIPLSSPLSSRPRTPAILSSSVADAFDDDDFADFHSSSHPLSRPVASQSLYDSSFSSTSDNQLFMTPERPLRPQGSASQPSFDDFDDFMSSPLRSPSPPRPPAKSTRAPSPNLRSTKKPQHLHLRKASAADHMATANLLERAAARAGRWPAPPSPLPEALPPPPRNVAASPFGVDLLGDATPLKPPDRKGLMAESVPSRPSYDPTSLMRPSSPPVQSLLDFSSFGSSPSIQPSASMGTTKAAISAANGKTDGLSAQDLSFFEGL